MNGVRQCPILFKSSKGDKELPNLFQHTGGKQASSTNEGITSPIEEPRIPCDNRFRLVPLHNISLGSPLEMSDKICFDPGTHSLNLLRAHFRDIICHHGLR